MAIKDVLQGAQDALTVKRVYGEPYERDGALIIPAAAVRGGGGGGGGRGSDESGGSGEGEGGGFGIIARPVGAFVFKDGRASWHPAVDVTRMFAMGCVVALGYFFATWRIGRAKVRSR